MKDSDKVIQDYKKFAVKKTKKNKTMIHLFKKKTAKYFQRLFQQWYGDVW